MKKLFIFIISFFFLTSCTSEHPQDVDKNTGNLTYQENTLILRPSKVDGHFTLLTMDKEYFYYSVENVKETEGEEGYEENVQFYRHVLKKNDASEELILTLDSPIFRDLCVEGEHAYFLLGRADEGGIYHVLQEYDMKGNLKSELSLKDILQERPDKVICLSDGCFGILTPGYFVIVNGRGERVLSVACPGEAYRGMVELADGRIGLAYQEKGNQNVSLVKLSRENKALSKAVTISGNGAILLAQEEGLIFVDSSGLNLLSDKENSRESVVSFAGRNITCEQLVCVQGNSQEYRVLGYSSDGTGAKYVCYSTQEQTTELAKEDADKYDNYGRRYIYLYDVKGELPKDMTNPVDAFNEQSDKYQVVVKDFHFDTEDSDTYDAGKMVASGEYPDLIFSSYNALIENLLNKKLLEDLIPYIEQSDNFSMEDLSPVVTNVYTKQDILFALPDYYVLHAIRGDVEYLGEGGWTVLEFLDWLVQNPKTGGMLSGRTAIYDACMDSILEQFVDFENKQISFNSMEFKNILSKLREINPKAMYTEEDVMELYENNIANIGTTIYHPGVIAVSENTNNYVMSVKGYPGTDGEPVVYLSSPAMSIFAGSEVKEGAYEFLEFYLTHVGEVLKDYTKMMGTSRFYTVNRYQEQTLQDLLLADNAAGTACMYSQEQLDKAMELLPYARLRDYSKEELKELIWEEILLYLDGKRELDATCDVIQNRVQLYVNER